MSFNKEIRGTSHHLNIRTLYIPLYFKKRFNEHGKYNEGQGVIVVTNRDSLKD